MPVSSASSESMKYEILPATDETFQPFSKTHFSATGFVDVNCKTQNMGQYGQQSLLECAVETSQEAAGAVFRTVSWKKEGIDEPLLLFHKGETIKQPGYSFAEPSWNNRNMNVSLHITDTAVDDQGVYTCMVMTDRGVETSETTLKVTGESFSHV